MVVGPDQFDLADGVGRVVADVYIEVVNRNLDVLGVVYPVLGVVYPDHDALSVVNDTSSTIMRRMDRLALTRADYASFNPAADLLRPVVEVDGRRYPMGAFYLTTDDDPIGRDTGLGGPAVDAGLVLASETTRSYSLPPGGSIVALMQDVIVDAGFTRLDMTDTGSTVYDPVVWPAGTARRAILNRLADLGGYLPPYFDNAGTFVVRAVDDVATADALIYGDTWRMIDPVLSRNLLDAPNVYRVVNNGAPNAEVAAVAYVDPALPWSRENRGFEVVRTVNQQGIRDYGSALKIAEALAARDAASYAGWEFTGPLDPRHDTFDAVYVDGAYYREVAWDADLVAGTMSHRLVTAATLKWSGGSSG